MGLSVEISLYPKGKRVLEEDGYGGGSIPKRRRVDSVRDWPRFCGPYVELDDASEDEEVEVDPELDDFVESKNEDDYDSDDDHIPIDQLKKPKKWEFEWVEVDNSDTEADHNSETEGDDDGSKDSSDDEAGCRNRVNCVRDHYQKLYATLSSEARNGGSGTKRPNIKAAMILKRENLWINCQPTIGHVPGVEIGDRFQFRAELRVIGLHHELNKGISYANMGDADYALSVVDSGRRYYDNKLKSSNVLIYSGHGGNPEYGGGCEDQTLQRGNLALKNSMDAKLPVRVIRKVEIYGEQRAYLYDGLYNVTRFWQERSPETGKMVYMFKMVRMEGQQESDYLDIISGQSRPMGVVSEDLSQGKEKFPVMVVNDFSDEKPQPFTYITEMISSLHLQEHRPVPSIGCDCVGGCSDSDPCALVEKNGGKIPFNEEGAILRSKKLVYECSPNCKCPPSCQNRVSQHGPRIPLEVFRTESMGWGLRSRQEIQSGSFVCEYIGEIIDDAEADRKTNEDYLMDLDAGGGFTVDAEKYGNVGRFINHSCSPNLYAQNVLYDYGNTERPHVMFFATRRIPALQELSYHYDYEINGSCDASGNIKKKKCCCGSRCCTGRLY